MQMLKVALLFHKQRPNLNPESSKLKLLSLKFGYAVLRVALPMDEATYPHEFNQVEWSLRERE